MINLMSRRLAQKSGNLKTLSQKIRGILVKFQSGYANFRSCRNRRAARGLIFEVEESNKTRNQNVTVRPEPSDGIRVLVGADVIGYWVLTYDERSHQMAKLIDADNPSSLRDGKSDHTSGGEIGPVKQTPEASPAAKGTTALQRPKQPEVTLDDSKVIACYANFCRVTGTPEELIIDFGLNNEPMRAPSKAIAVTQRLVMNYFTAKRMLAALQMSVQRHEAAFGVLETDVQRRIVPNAIRNQPKHD